MLFAVLEQEKRVALVLDVEWINVTESILCCFQISTIYFDVCVAKCFTATATSLTDKLAGRRRILSRLSKYARLNRLFRKKLRFQLVQVTENNRPYSTLV